MAQEETLKLYETVAAMRMIGIGLMGFLLAGVALLLSTMNILERGKYLFKEMTTGSQLVFEHRLPAQAEGIEVAEIQRSNTDHPVILSGFPAYQSVAFSLPKDARPTSGYLQINATAQVLTGVEGALRVSIHNVRRGELLLRPGEVGRSLQIPLSPSDFASDQLVVSFSLQGTGSQQQCGPDDDIAAIVEIEATSTLHLTLNEPLASVRDRVRAWGDVVRVAWPAWLQQDEQTRRLLLSVQATQRGLRTRFLPVGEEDALTTTALRNVLANAPEMETPATDLPQFLAQDGVNAGLRRFNHGTSWRTRYALVDGRKQRIPASLDLHLILGNLLGDHLWSLTVTLNNRLLIQSSIEGARAPYKVRIDLPADWQKTQNQIEVTATSTAQRDSLCSQGPELLAEMLPDTQLVPGLEIYAGPVDALRAALGKTQPIRVSLRASLTAVEAERAANWLAQIIDPSATLKPAEQKAQIVITGQGDVLSDIINSGPAWVLTQGSAAGSFDVHSVVPGQALPDASLLVLIVPSGIDMSGSGVAL